jgi:resuscitation-promoting factor RpfA
MSSRRVSSDPPAPRRTRLPAAPPLGPPPRRSRLGPALALLTAVVLLLTGLLATLAAITREAWQQVLAPGPAGLDALATGITGPVAFGLSAWLLLAVLISTADALLVLAKRSATGWPAPHSVSHPREPVLSSYARAIAPPLIRHGIAALVGVVLLGAPAAASDTRPAPPISTSVSPTVSSTVGPSLNGWLPQVPAAAASARSSEPGIDLVTAAGRHRRLDDDDQVVVRRGDTLWSIAARSLGPSARSSEVAQEWPKWFSANRAVIGDDPDLLTPGQRLRPPAAAATAPTGSRRSR